MKFKIVPAILIGIILSIVSSKIAYFGFNSSIMANVFTQESFRNGFGNDIYRYRILSSSLLLALDNTLSTIIDENGEKEPVLKHAKGSTNHFYYAFYYLNTFFLILVSVIIVLLLNLKNAFLVSDGEKYILLFIAIMSINYTQFIICPYDISSYFFQLLTLYIFLRFMNEEFLLTTFAVASLILISTLNRESSALSIAITTILALQKWGFKRRMFFFSGLSALAFTIAYVGIRFILKDSGHTKVLNPLAGHPFLPENIMGVIFWGVFFLLPIMTSNNKKNKWLIGSYHLLSLPYIYMCLKDGALWEIRLYIPLFLGSLFLAKINTDNTNKFPAFT